MITEVLRKILDKRVEAAKLNHSDEEVELLRSQVLEGSNEAWDALRQWADEQRDLHHGSRKDGGSS